MCLCVGSGLGLKEYSEAQTRELSDAVSACHFVLRLWGCPRADQSGLPASSPGKPGVGEATWQFSCTDLGLRECGCIYTISKPLIAKERMVRVSVAPKSSSVAGVEPPCTPPSASDCMTMDTSFHLLAPSVLKICSKTEIL